MHSLTMRGALLRRAGLVGAAAVMVCTVVLASSTASAATIGSIRSWSAGTMAPGQSKTYTWKNANSDIYQVNTGAVQADDPGAPCYIEVTRQRYRRTASGARTLVLTIKNVDSVACDVVVYLAPITADRSGSTGLLQPGQSKAWKWNNADVNHFVYFAGASPSTPDSGTCQFELSWKNRAVPDGEQEFVWAVRNTGSVACAGQWRLGWLPVEDRTFFPDDDPPSDPSSRFSLNSPLLGPFRVYVFNLLPRATEAGNCEWGPAWFEHRMAGDPAVPTEGARTEFGFGNVGTVPCVLHGVTQTFIG